MFTTPWISRTAAVLLLMALAAAIHLWAVEPLLAAYARTDAAIAETRELLARFDRLAAARPDLVAQAEALERQPTMTAAYLEGATDALAAAALQARVTALIAGSGGSLASIQTLPSRTERGFTRVTIRVQMAAPIEALVPLLYDLETGLPLLFVDSLEIQGDAATLAGGSVSHQQPLLTVGFDLAGYMPPEAP